MEQQDNKPRIRVLPGYEARYLVESRSNPGNGHQCDLVLKKCSCKAGHYGLLCWHAAFAASYHAWRMEQGLGSVKENGNDNSFR